MGSFLDKTIEDFFYHNYSFEAMPIILGITGHRDIRKEDQIYLKRVVREFIDNLLKQYSSCPICLLSPLAEGADRLVAEVVLEIPNSSLIVPLPMPINEYERDFQTDNSKAEFNRLLQEADLVLTLPLLKDNSPKIIHCAGDERDRQYEQLGAYIVQHSQLLISLWDGISIDKIGGTSEIVRFGLEGVPQIYVNSESLLDTVRSEAVIHIYTPRATGDSKNEKLGEIWYIFPDNKRRIKYKKALNSHVLKRINQFNHDAIKFSRHKMRIMADRSSSESNIILLFFVIADAMAKKFQIKSRRCLIGTILFGIIAIIFHQIYSIHGHLLEAFIRFFYLGAIIITICTYLVGKKKDWQGKHLDYRFLAEVLRIQFYLKTSGIESSIADHFLNIYQRELDWIRYVIRYTDIKTSDSKKKSFGGKELQFVLDEWVDDQFHFFAGDQKKHSQGAAEFAENKNNFYSKAAVISLVIGLLIVIMMLFSHFIGYRGSEWNHLTFMMRLSSIILLTISGGLKSYATFMAFSEHARSYEKLGFIFGRGKKVLQNCLLSRSFDEGQKIVLELGKEALTENSEWIILHRARPISLPRIIRMG